MKPLEQELNECREANGETPLKWKKGTMAALLSPAVGHVTHFPVYRSKGGGPGTLHRRYGGCNRPVRARPFPAQGDEYQALGFFHTCRSNAIAVNDPGARK